jgi:dihydrofolate reductase
MKKITAGLFISLDGVVEAPDQWHFPYFNDEMGAAVDAGLGAADTILFGRKTYDSFAGAWPEREAAGGEDAHFAKVLGDARKIVVSNQRLELTWRNSEQLQGDLIEAVTALKNEPADGTIGMSGSVSVVRQLLAAGLLDELHLLVHPIAVRTSMRLFDEGEPPIPLKLISSVTFETGVLNLVYTPRRVVRPGELRRRQDSPAPARTVGQKEMVEVTSGGESLEALEPFVGEWSLVAAFKNAPPADAGARVTFEWLPGRKFLIERWEVPVPEAPDGIAIVGADPEREGNYLQHYFDSRGVARVYKMSFVDGVWTLWRDESDFSPLDFSQRFTGTFRHDGKTIAGAWEISNDGKTWEHDFDLTYTKVG